jgi:hypothetical protein
LGTLGADEAPFSQGALVAFRERLIAHDPDHEAKYLRNAAPDGTIINAVRHLFIGADLKVVAMP